MELRTNMDLHQWPSIPGWPALPVWTPAGVLRGMRGTPPPAPVWLPGMQPPPPGLPYWRLDSSGWDNGCRRLDGIIRWVYETHPVDEVYGWLQESPAQRSAVAWVKLYRGRPPAPNLLPPAFTKADADWIAHQWALTEHAPPAPPSRSKLEVWETTPAGVQATVLVAVIIATCLGLRLLMELLRFAS